MEKAAGSAGETFHCVPVGKGLAEHFPKNNWQKVDRGYLTPAEGLMASCNPVFYEIALRLDHVDPNILPEFARGFGYGGAPALKRPGEEPGRRPRPRVEGAGEGRTLVQRRQREHGHRSRGPAGDAPPDRQRLLGDRRRGGPAQAAACAQYLGGGRRPGGGGEGGGAPPVSG